MKFTSDWKQSNIQSFWGDIAASRHLVQIYENDRVFLETLEGFAGSGFLAGDCVVIIATRAHQEALNIRLTKQGFRLDLLVATHQYLTIEAEEMLVDIFVEGRIRIKELRKIARSILSLAREKNRNVRLFGEGAALLWQQGEHKQALRIEAFWNRLIKNSAICVYCAYPASFFRNSPEQLLDDVCSVHSTLIGGWPKPSTELFYIDDPEVSIQKKSSVAVSVKT